MNDEIDDEILEAELTDDALEKKMRKLEADAARILHQSNEVLREMNKGKEKQEEAQEDGSVKIEDIDCQDTQGCLAMTIKTISNKHYKCHAGLDPACRKITGFTLNTLKDTIGALHPPVGGLQCLFLIFLSMC